MNRMDGESTDVEPRENENIAKKNKQTKLKSKYICIVSVVVVNIIIWIILFSPFIVILGIIPTRNVTNGSPNLFKARMNTLPDELPPLNTSQDNYTILSIQCENNFVFEPKGSICYPPCSFDPSGNGLTPLIQIVLLTISGIGLIMSVGTLIGWLVASYLECRKKNSCEFQLARASLFMVVLFILGIFATYIAIDTLGRDQLFCDRNREGELYLLAHMFELATDPGVRRTLTNVIGAILYFFTTSTFYWVMIAFANILLVIFLPLQVNQSVKRQGTLFCIQMALGLFVSLILIAIIYSINPTTPFASNYQVQQVYVSGHLTLLLLLLLLTAINAGLVLTMAIIALTKLRLVSLHTKKLTGRRRELTDLEKRLLIYAFLYSTLATIIVVTLGVISLLENSYLDLIREHILCVNSNSAITIQLPNSTQMTNTNITTYRQNRIGNLTACNAILVAANGTLPAWLTLSFSVAVRLIWLVVFAILIPRCTPKCIHMCIIRNVNKRIHKA